MQQPFSAGNDLLHNRNSLISVCITFDLHATFCCDFWKLCHYNFFPRPPSSSINWLTEAPIIQTMCQTLVEYNKTRSSSVIVCVLHLHHRVNQPTRKKGQNRAINLLIFVKSHFKQWATNCVAWPRKLSEPAGWEHAFCVCSRLIISTLHNHQGQEIFAFALSHDKNLRTR